MKRIYSPEHRCAIQWVNGGRHYINRFKDYKKALDRFDFLVARNCRPVWIML